MSNFTKFIWGTLIDLVVLIIFAALCSFIWNGIDLHLLNLDIIDWVGLLALAKLIRFYLTPSQLIDGEK